MNYLKRIRASNILAILFIALILMFLVMSIRQDQPAVTLRFTGTPIALTNISQLDRLDDNPIEGIIRFVPDSSSFVSVQDRTIYLTDYAQGLTTELNLPPSDFFSLVISSDGTRIAWMDGNSTIRLWDLSENSEILQITTPRPIYYIAYRASNGPLVSISESNVDIWDTSTGQVINTFAASRVCSVSLDLRGEYVAWTTPSDEVRIWNLRLGTHEAILSFQGAKPQLMSFNPLDPEEIAILYDDHSIKFWNFIDTRVIQVLQDQGRVTSMALAPHEAILVTTSMTDASTVGRLNLWDTATGRLVRNVDLGRQLGVADVSISASGDMVAFSTGTQGAYQFWGIPNSP
jgi:WD40 repeat protein